MVITLMCKAVAAKKTQKGSYRVVYVTEDGEIFTSYQKDPVTADVMEELEIMAMRTFSARLDDTIFFPVE